MMYFHMQKLKFIDFMVIELSFFKKRKMRNVDKHNQLLYTGYFSHILQLDIVKPTSKWNEQYPYIWFSMGIDHSNPYIYTVLLYCVIELG